MIIPYSTSAPLYYFPFATVGMMVANVAVFLVTSKLTEHQQEEYLVPWILQYGTLNPLQWITSNFIHGGFFHLLGNMFGLWAFGLIVEGKVGWTRFLAIFFLIGVVQCAIEQVFMLGADGGASYGVSAIVFGLVGISLIWAPENEVSCVIVIGWRMLDTELKVLTMGEILIGIEILGGIFSGLSWGSQALHLMGAGVGIAIGIVMVKRNWVDCENWDLFSYWRGDQLTTISERDEDAIQELLGESPVAMAGKPAALRAGQQKGKKAVSQTDTIRRSVTSPPEAKLTEVRQHLQRGDPSAAFLAHQRFAASDVGWRLPEPELLGLIAAYHRKEMWSESIPAMVEYLRNYLTRETQVRLRLAQILIVHEGRPAQALHVMQYVNEALLEPQQADLVTKLRNKARLMREEGVLETDVENW